MRSLSFLPLAILFVLVQLSLPAQPGRDKRITRVSEAQRQSFTKQPKVAILVGVGAYPAGSGLARLKYAANDVRELAGELEKAGYAVHQMVDDEATRGVVVRALNQLGEMLDPDEGTALFYFSGHGFTQGGANYLATFGATVDDLQREGLAVAEVEQLMKRAGSRRQVLWIDACRNDPNAGARDASRRTFAELKAGEGLRTLYSTRPGSLSYEDDSLHHGVFTYFLLKGLRGEAAGADGLVTSQDLSGYLSDAVLNYSVKTGHAQRPFESGEASGDFLLADFGPKVSAPPPAPVTPLRPSAPDTTPHGKAGCDDFDTCFQTGSDAVMAGNWRGAVAALTVAVRLDPQSGPAWLSLGKAYLGAGQSDNVGPSWDKALELGQTLSVPVCHKLGGIVLRQCEEGALSIGASEVSFVPSSGKPLFAASPARARITSSTNNSVVAIFNLEVDGKKFEMQFVPLGIACTPDYLLRCNSKGVAQQALVATYLTRALAKLASGGFRQ